MELTHVYISALNQLFSHRCKLLSRMEKEELQLHYVERCREVTAHVGYKDALLLFGDCLLCNFVFRMSLLLLQVPHITCEVNERCVLILTILCCLELDTHSLLELAEGLHLRDRLIRFGLLVQMIFICLPYVIVHLIQ